CVIALFCVGFLATGYLLAAGQLGYAALFNGHQTIAWWSQWVQTLSTLTLIAVVLAAMHGFGNDSWSHRKLLAVFLVVQCGAGFVAGFKSAVLVPLVYTLFTYYFFKRSIPKRVVLAAVVVPLLLVP